MKTNNKDWMPQSNIIHDITNTSDHYAIKTYLTWKASDKCNNYKNEINSLVISLGLK